MSQSFACNPGQRGGGEQSDLSKQPTSGPGGSDYSHMSVTIENFGTGMDEYWIFQPNDPPPTNAPVVMFLHGFGGTMPAPYSAWIQHIVRKGHIVVFPRYQENARTPLDASVEAADRATKAAWQYLVDNSSISEEGIAWIGHSFGGFLITDLSMRYEDNNMPPPVVLMLVEPGGRQFEINLDNAPDNMLSLLILGDEDSLVTKEDVQPYIAELINLPANNVNMLLIQSDDNLKADHFAPLSEDVSFLPTNKRLVNNPDFLDFYGYWKLLDGLIDASFRGINKEYALGDTQEQKFMGVYSNGRSVNPIEVLPLD